MPDQTQHEESAGYRVSPSKKAVIMVALLAGGVLVGLMGFYVHHQNLVCLKDQVIEDHMLYRWLCR